MTEEEFQKAIAAIGDDAPVHNAKMVTRDSDIEFNCQRCGECCKNRNGEGAILLSPIDIYNGAKVLGITTEEFLNNYTSTYIGHNSGMVCCVLACDDEGTCKLLEKDGDIYKCKVHSAKPTICALHPLGIMHSKKPDTDETERVYIMVDQCDNSRNGKVIKASEILDNLPCTEEENNICVDLRVPDTSFVMKNAINTIVLNTLFLVRELTDEEQEEHHIGMKTKIMVAMMTGEYERRFGEFKPEYKDRDELKECLKMQTQLLATREFFNMLFVYERFDTNKPFMEQAQENLKEYREYMSVIKNVYDEIVKDMTKDFPEEKIKEFKEFVNMASSL